MEQFAKYFAVFCLGISIGAVIVSDIWKQMYDKLEKEIT